MKDGNLTVHFEAGKIKRVVVNSGLDYNYERLYKKALRFRKNHSKDVDNNIKIILFGALCIEAKINNSLKELLFKEIKNNEFIISIWKIIGRSSINQKAEIVFKTLVMDANISAYKKKIQEVFDIRNQLVHFKEIDTDVIDSEIHSAEFFQRLETFPEPELITKLKGPLIETIINNTNSILILFKTKRHYLYKKNKTRA